jgi:hypothetical protein
MDQAMGRAYHTNDVLMYIIISMIGHFFCQAILHAAVFGVFCNDPIAIDEDSGPAGLNAGNELRLRRKIVPRGIGVICFSRVR